jgi:hypothetical protein
MKPYNAFESEHKVEWRFDLRIALHTLGQLLMELGADVLKRLGWYLRRKKCGQEEWYRECVTPDDPALRKTAKVSFEFLFSLSLPEPFKNLGMNQMSLSVLAVSLSRIGCLAEDSSLFAAYLRNWRRTASVGCSV